MCLSVPQPWGPARVLYPCEGTGWQGGEDASCSPTAAGWEWLWAVGFAGQALVPQGQEPWMEPEKPR